jgi:hypothetical protein
MILKKFAVMKERKLQLYATAAFAAYYFLNIS